MAKLPVPNIDYVSFLVGRKFPQLQSAFSNLVNTDHNTDEARPSAQLIQQAQEYRAELNAKPKAELQKLYADETKTWRAERDRQHFFDPPDAAADFDYWSKMAHWKLEEALALSFGRNPQVVNERAFSGIYDSPFIQEFRKLEELAKRAIAWKHLYNPVMPSIYVAWTKKNDIAFPAALAALVERRSANMMDWQKMYNDLVVQNNSNVKITNEMIAQKDKEIEELKTARATEKPLNTKEKDSLLKIIIGIAVDAYGYDPSEVKSPFYKELEGILAKQGIQMTDDTIRKWLKEAAELLPGEKP